MTPGRIVWLDPDHQRVRDGEGAVVAELARAVASYPTADGELIVEVIGSDLPALPQAGNGEPWVGILARCCQALRGREAALVVHGAGSVIDTARAPLLQGVTALGLGDAADEAVWDAALDAGLPLWGLCGSARCEIPTHLAVAVGVTRALAMGSFACEDGLAIAELDEQRGGVRWRWAEPAATAVVVRGGYEVERRAGTSGEWQDRGNEGWMRLVASTGSGGRALTQPRFIAGGSGV